MPITEKVSGVTKTHSAEFENAGGVMREKSSVQVNDGGVMRTIFSAGTGIGDFNVGDIVQIKEDGVETDYIIVHKGLPGDKYDSSCDGVWLLRKNLLPSRRWDGTGTADARSDYENSDINAWLNSDYLNSIDANIRSAIKSVKIPYKKGAGPNTGYTVQNGAKGLGCQAFLLSSTEVGAIDGDTLTIGQKLDYFIVDTYTEEDEDGYSELYPDSLERRVAKKDDDTAGTWWLRSPCKLNTAAVYTAIIVAARGTANTSLRVYNLSGVRPAFILPHDFLI